MTIVYSGIAYVYTHSGDNDLEVEWGMQWGCPHTPSDMCRSIGQGAFYEVSSYDEKKTCRNMRKWRTLREADGDDDDGADDTDRFYGYETVAKGEVFDEEVEEACHASTEYYSRFLTQLV